MEFLQAEKQHESEYRGEKAKLQHKCSCNIVAKLPKSHYRSCKTLFLCTN
jgi:hypothetical protein